MIKTIEICKLVTELKSVFGKDDAAEIIEETIL